MGHQKAWFSGTLRSKYTLYLGVPIWSSVNVEDKADLNRTLSSGSSVVWRGSCVLPAGLRSWQLQQTIYAVPSVCSIFLSQASTDRHKSVSSAPCLQPTSAPKLYQTYKNFTGKVYPNSHFTSCHVTSRDQQSDSGEILQQRRPNFTFYFLLF